jgi:chromosomal replication initiator protein
MSELEGRVSAMDLGFWVRSIRPIALREGCLHAEVPSALHVEQIRLRCDHEIRAVLAEICGSPTTIALTVNKALAEARPAEVEARSTNPYSFESFVVGTSNAFAHASALAVAEGARTGRNPFFVHGGVGLGKTHLAHAIADRVGRDSRRRVLMLSAESFANELIRSFATNAVEGFRARMRRVDVLIVDDIQFLAKKERMQEEFFHTFNALYAAGKQIVLASDQRPRAIPGLEDRLTSRFESGLIAEIKMPEVPLRLAILMQKAKMLRFELPLDVAQWVASKVVASVRELEGALHRLIAACQWSGRSPDLRFANEVLRPLLRTAPPQTIEQIQRLVAESFQVTPEELVRHGRATRLRIPRQVAMYLARRRTQATYVEIAAGFGGRDHSTVMHAVKCVETRSREEPDFADLVEQISDRLKSV